MAHFRTEVKGNRGWVTRTGTKDSGMVAHVHGWNFGIKVDLFHDHDTGEDFAQVYRTGGKNGENNMPEFLFEVTPTEIITAD